MSNFSEDNYLPEDEENEEEPGSVVVEQPQKVINTVCPGSIKNVREFYAAKSRRLNDLRREKEPVGDDFPSTDTAKQELVKDIFAVMKNTTSNEIIDRRVRTGKLARGIRMMESGIFDDEFIEQKCWELMLAAADTSRGIQLNDPKHSKENKFESYPTFLARWDEIKHTLLVSKAACENMLKLQEFLYRLADAPKQCLKAKKNNITINNKRDQENEAGRRAFREGLIDPADLLDRRPTIGDPVGPPRQTNNISDKKNSKTTPKTPASGRVKSAVANSSKSISKRKAQTQSLSQESEGDDNADSSYTPSKKQTTAVRKPRSGSNLQTASNTNDNDVLDDGESFPTRHGVIRRQPASRTSAPAAFASSQMGGRSQVFPQNVPQFMNQGPPSQLMSHMRQERPQSNMQSMNISQEMHLDPRHSNLLAQQTMIKSLEDRYKRIVCRIIGVNHQYAQMYSLKELRIYAHAYNLAFQGFAWRSPLFSEVTALGPILSMNDGTSQHIAQYYSRFMHLAHARGDFDAQPPRYIQSASNEEEKALGLYNNEFGPVETIK
ncbi:hypothetical protein BJ875DRAFT_485467 [Amylocarpus encephaloides]|uniref:Uncharacterized protein n=1 Tax=Amylocarpus encephaloides TaxID=45428 RepID=A0A9P7YG82_9HELO|nr:hypothetical protein BJ875DRAFT_485467 [Amylocarpus encephaloides]